MFQEQEYKQFYLCNILLGAEDPARPIKLKVNEKQDKLAQIMENGINLYLIGQEGYQLYSQFSSLDGYGMSTEINNNFNVICQLKNQKYINLYSYVSKNNSWKFEFQIIEGWCNDVLTFIDLNNFSQLIQITQQDKGKLFQVHKNKLLRKVEQKGFKSNNSQDYYLGKKYYIFYGQNELKIYKNLHCGIKLQQIINKQYSRVQQIKMSNDESMFFIFDHFYFIIYKLDKLLNEFIEYQMINNNNYKSAIFLDNNHILALNETSIIQYFINDNTIIDCCSTLKWNSYENLFFGITNIDFIQILTYNMDMEYFSWKYNIRLQI